MVFVRLLGIGMLAFTLVSCSIFTQGEANKLVMGISPEAAKEMVSDVPHDEFEFTVMSIPNDKFLAIEYIMALGTSRTPFFLVFRNNKLFYWGFPYEFNRYPDAEMNAIGRALVAAADER